MKELLDGFSVERLEEISSRIEMYGHGAGYTADEVLALARVALALKQAQPVSYTSVDALADVACGLTAMMGPENAVGSIPLYTNSQLEGGE